MNAVSTKVLSLPICPVYFHLVMPRHVLSPCYARYEDTTGIKGYVTYYLGMLCEGYKCKTCCMI